MCIISTDTFPRDTYITCAVGRKRTHYVMHSTFDFKPTWLANKTLNHNNKLYVVIPVYNPTQQHVAMYSFSTHRVSSFFSTFSVSSSLHNASKQKEDDDRLVDENHTNFSTTNSTMTPEDMVFCMDVNQLYEIIPYFNHTTTKDVLSNTYGSMYSYVVAIFCPFEKNSGISTASSSAAGTATLISKKICPIGYSINRPLNNKPDNIVIPTRLIMAMIPCSLSSHQNNDQYENNPKYIEWDYHLTIASYTKVRCVDVAFANTTIPTIGVTQQHKEKHNTNSINIAATTTTTSLKKIVIHDSGIQMTLPPVFRECETRHLSLTQKSSLQQEIDRTCHLYANDGFDILSADDAQRCCILVSSGQFENKDMKLASTFCISSSNSNKNAGSTTTINNRTNATKSNTNTASSSSSDAAIRQQQGQQQRQEGFTHHDQRLHDDIYNNNNDQKNSSKKCCIL